MEYVPCNGTHWFTVDGNSVIAICTEVDGHVEEHYDDILHLQWE